MNCTIAHRGPDDEGYILINRRTGRNADFCGPASPRQLKPAVDAVEFAGSWSDANGPDLFIAHRRFAIISPTPEGHQPFRDSDNALAVLFNGEIYNYVELRAELSALGVTFRTATDTEVLAEAYKTWGLGCFEKLNGMWAIALYDFRKRLLLLSRDRTGERPLYWATNSKGIFFASEIKALFTSDLICPDRTANDKSAYGFLSQALADVDTSTFFEGIESLPPASIVTIDVDDNINTARFWRVPEPQSRIETLRAGSASELSSVTEQLRSLLRDSVAIRLRADVPVNVALSGGMDSSSIVAMAASLRSDGLDTYTVRFEDPEWNEWPYASAVANMYGVRNFVAEPQANWTWRYLSRFVADMEEPFHAPDLVSDHVIRHILSRNGFKVSLSGIGGDELFAGYEYYRGLYAGSLKRSGQRIAAVREILLASEKSPVTAGWRLIGGKLRGLFQPSNHDSLAAEAILKAPGAKTLSLPDSIEARLAADVEWALLPYWLRAGDKSSMAVPIEVRYPFLDHRLIEFVAGLPVSYLIRDGWLKWILRKAIEDLLPKEVVWRRKKMGFPAPIVELLSDSLPQLRSIFGAMDNPYLSKKFWTQKLELAVQRSPWMVWRALSLELWHRYYIRSLPVLPGEVEQQTKNSDEAAFCAA